MNPKIIVEALFALLKLKFSLKIRFTAINSGYC